MLPYGKECGDSLVAEACRGSCRAKRLAAHRQPRDTGAPGASVKHKLSSSEERFAPDSVGLATQNCSWLRLGRNPPKTATGNRPRPVRKTETKPLRSNSATACVTDRFSDRSGAVSGSPRTHNAFPFPSQARAKVASRKKRVQRLFPGATAQRDISVVNTRFSVWSCNLDSTPKLESKRNGRAGAQQCGPAWRPVFDSVPLRRGIVKHGASAASRRPRFFRKKARGGSALRRW